MTSFKIPVIKMNAFRWMWLLVLLFSSPGLTRNPPPVESGPSYCTSVFNVWQPGLDAQMMFREIYAKVDNLTAFTKFEVAELKSYMIQELSSIRNSSFTLEKRMLLKQIEMMDEELLQMKLYTGTSTVKTDLQSVTRRVAHIERSLGSLQTKLPNSRTGKMRPRHDSLPQQQGVNSDLAVMLKNSVGDLKAEWLLLKRDVESLKKETRKLQEYRTAVLNDTFSMKVSLDSVTSDTNKIEMKAYEVADMQNRLETRMDGLTSNLDQLSLQFTEHKEEMALQKDTVDSLQESSARLQQELNDVHVRLAYTSGRSGGGGGGSQMSHIPTITGEVHTVYPGPAENVVLNRSPEVVHVTGESSKNVKGARKNDYPKDCHDVYNQGYRVSAEYQILPASMTQLQSVYCQMINGTGFTLLQRRIDGTLNFNRRWLEYKQGFGNPYGEMWVGNELIHRLTTQKQYILRVDMWDWEGHQYYAEYSRFSIHGETDSYKLQVDGYSGNAGDSMLLHNDMAFSTEDADNDRHARHCAAENKGGWWYRSCFTCQLNGIYHTAWYTESSYADGIAWYTLKDSEYYSLKKVEMKVKPATP